MADNNLQLDRISKLFPGVKALDQVSLSVQAGEVHALCGENGAGKSTLMNILSGNLQPNEGTITWKGQEVQISNPIEAQRLGIAIVYQERSLVETLSVAENIFIRNKPRNRLGLIDFPQLYRKTQDLLDRLGLSAIRPRSLVSSLSIANQQMVEIAKALAQEPELLILDEPTASITEVEADILFAIIRRLKQQEVAVIYISHRMAEIFEIADRVSVLKDGRYQGTFPISEVTVDTLIRTMVGRDLQVQDAESHTTSEVVLEVQQLQGERFQDVSFQLKKGEILALAGLVGAGRTEVARAILGADPLLGGTILLEGKHVKISHPKEAIQQGIGYLPESRKTQGLFLDMSVADNVVAANLPTVADKGFLQPKQIRKKTEEYIRQLRIVTPGSQQKVLNLSGGNQQKVVLAKWLMRQPKVFIVDEPTHGVDVGAKSEIYAILNELTRQGVSILLISSELPEVLLLSDRILVMWNGKVTAELSRKQATEEEIMHYASGTKTMYA
uniref:Sugar ABC transporter ATP-binding protein n=1 Tax=Roseihalotalea indica TaxID=2867963 RepID=A0AA49GSM0_9BACT|nr:sugar ABC transporter ATP-binding protein [Tunicatimonas sp. TK19036]